MIQMVTMLLATANRRLLPLAYTANLYINIRTTQRQLIAPRPTRGGLWGGARSPRQSSAPNEIFTESVSTGGNAIASVRPFVRLFPLYLLNRLTFGLDLLHIHVWVTTVSRRRLKLKVTGEGQDAVGLTSILDRGQFSSC